MTDPEVINMLQKIDRSLDADANINDDEKVFYGDDNDFSERYDSATDEFRTMDEINDQDVVGVTKSRDVKHFGDTLYPNIGGSPTFSGHDHSETGTSAVSNSGLVNSTVTYSPGVGINGAGSVGLGGSATIDVGPDDDEAIPWGTDDDIEVTYVSAQDAIEFIDPTGPTPRVRVSRTGPFELVNSNLRIATGQVIEDGGGTRRFRMASGSTQLFDDSGVLKLDLNAGGNSNLQAYSGESVGIFDQEGGFTSVQYDTDVSVGVLRTPNAGLVVQADANVGAGLEEGANIRYTGSAAVLQGRDGAGSNIEAHLSGSTVKLVATGGLVDMSSQAADLRLATGQSIEDGSGASRFRFDSGGTDIFDGGNGSINVSLSSTSGFDVSLSSGLFDISGGAGNDLRLATGQAIEDESGAKRLEILSGRTQLYNNNNELAFRAINNTAIQVFARSSEPFHIRDAEGSFDAVQYTSSATSPGTLELTNAVLDARADSGLDGTGVNVSLKLRASGSTTPVGLREASGELLGVDNAGNTTTLT